MDSLSLSPSPPRGPAPPPHPPIPGLWGPAGAGAGPMAEHPFPPEPGLLQGAQGYRPSNRNEIVPMSVIRARALLGSPGPSAIGEKESPEDHSVKSVVELLNNIAFSRNHFAVGAIEPFDAKRIGSILKSGLGRNIPADLRPTPYAPLQPGRMPSNPEKWGPDYRVYLDTNGDDTLLTVYKRIHLQGRYDVEALAVFSIDGNTVYVMFPDPEDMHLRPLGDADMNHVPTGGRRRRRRTRRITKASRYPRSGTRSRSRR